MITLDSGLNLYEDGLNARRERRGGGFIKRNLASAKRDISIKNAIKLVKVAAPIGLSFIPVGGGVASKLGGKLLNKGGKSNLLGRAVTGVSGNGKRNLFGRVTDRANKFGKTKLGNGLKEFEKPLARNAKNRLLQNAGVTPTDAQLETLAENEKTGEEPTPATKDNTMLYVGGGILALGLGYLAFKK